MMISLALVVAISRLDFGEIIVGIFSIGIEIYYILATEFQKWTHFSDTGVHGFLRVIAYIFVGYLIAKNLKRIELFSSIGVFVGFIICLFLFIVENFIIWHLGGYSDSQEVIMTVPTSTFTALLSLKWQPKNVKPDVRKYSTFMYCSQMWPFFFLNKLFNSNLLMNQLYLFLGVTIITYVGYVTYKFISEKSNWHVLSYMV